MPGFWVFDAGVFVRAALYDHSGAQDWLERVGTGAALVVPDLIWIEIANAVKRRLVAQRVTVEDADAILECIAKFPAESRPLKELLPAAWALARSTRLSAYDACYLALAAAAKATLVTFDADFVGLYDRVELLR